jgi:hypothetical protein
MPLGRVNHQGVEYFSRHPVQYCQTRLDVAMHRTEIARLPVVPELDDLSRHAGFSAIMIIMMPVIARVTSYAVIPHPFDCSFVRMEP